MAWNEPGNNNENDPWGNRGKNDGPPDLDEVIKNMQRKLSGILGGGGKSSNDDGSSTSGGNSTVFGLVILVAFIVWLISGWYIVQPAERGVVMRFGAYTQTTMPGPHWHFPYPIETVEKVNVTGVRTTTIGFGNTGTAASEALMLTKDENIIELKVEVQFHVENAADYLFNVVNPDLTLRQMTESAVREVVGKTAMDEVFKTGRAAMAKKAEVALQALLEDYGTGLVVTNFNMPDIQPPPQVQAAFADVVKADADKESQINEAYAYAKDIVPRARGKATRILQEAEAYNNKVIAKARGESSRFDQVLTAYEKAPTITKERLYLDTMESVYAKSQKILVDMSKDSNNVLYLPLDRMSGSANLPPTRIDLGSLTTYPSTNSISTSPSQPVDARSRGGR